MSEALQTYELFDDQDEVRSREVGTNGLFSSREIAGRDSTNLYLEEISRTPLLSAEEEVELSKTIEAGLAAQYALDNESVSDTGASREELEWLAEEGERAKLQFTQANLRLVVSIARKYGGSGMPMLDLIQEGNDGLIRAVQKFDYTKGYKFSTYATWWIRQSITRGIHRKSRIVTLPIHVAEQVRQLGGAMIHLERNLGREPEPSEVAEELGLSVERVMNLMAWSRDHVSLDQGVDDDSETRLIDLLHIENTESPEDQAIAHAQKEHLEDLLSYLKPRTAEVMRLRYGLADGREHKLKDVGAYLGISAERVRQLEREGIAILKRIEAGEQVERPEPKPERQVELGKRALLRIQLGEMLQAVGDRLSDDHVSVLQSYIRSSSQRTAAIEQGVSTGAFGTKFRLARQALDAAVMG